MASGTISISPNNQNICSDLGGDDTITLSSVSVPGFHRDTIDLSMLGAMESNSFNSPYTVTTGPTYSGGFNAGVGWTGANATPWTQAPRINLDGEGADIVVNGWSLVDAVKRIEQRLGLFQPNPQLETEWDQLKLLSDQYRELEQQILAKQATWDRLRAMPAPEID